MTLSAKVEPASAAYERSFVAAAPVTRAWLAMADPEEREAWMGNPYGDRFQPAEIEIGTVEPLRRMSWSQRSAGTRITITRRGFRDSEAWRHYADNTGITHVLPGGFAAEAGMRAGDVLLRLDGASVVHLTDVAFLGREHAPGEVIEAEWARGATVLRGRAPLSEWHYGDDGYVGHPGAYPTASLTASAAL